MNASTAAIGVMCKAPRPGRTKTRLAAAIGAAAAADLSACFVRDVAAAIEEVPTEVGRHGYGIYAPAGAESALRELLPPGFDLMVQVADDLGMALSGAAEALLAMGHDCVLLVNGDSPTLPPSFLSRAIASLRQQGDRMVLGPAADGGYFLIGLKHPHRHLFTNIEWGTDTVAESTRQRAAEIGLSVTELPEWYDIDDAQTLGWLKTELAGGAGRFRGGGRATATRAFLARLDGTA
jgi:rSAM/selenodomain-associated transferase 1